MPQIYSNPSYKRSFTSNTVDISQAKLDTILTLSVGDKSITIIPQFEYWFQFYDPVYGTIRNLKALVEDILDNNQIKVKYIKSENQDFVDCNKCKCKCQNWIDNSKEDRQKPMPTCNCILNPPDMSKYEGPITLYIPIENLVNVVYVKSGEDKDPKKGETKVMLLGISAEMVKAIIIRMEFFDDSLPDAVKLIDVKVGGIYDIAYQDEDGTIYESRSKVVKIEEDDDHEQCKPGKGFVRECVGSDNSVYYCCDRSHSKEDFMQEPPVKKVRLIVDTSEDFIGRYEVIMLDTIRDCTLVTEAQDEPIEPTDPVDDICKCCKDKYDGCNKETCGHYYEHVCGDNCSCKKVYNFDNDNYKATLSKDQVHIDSKDNEPIDVSVDELIKFYLGLE